MSKLTPQRTATVFFSTGELSGEMHAAHLSTMLQRLRAERGLQPAIIDGNGAARMKEAGVNLLFDVSTWGEMGIVANMAKAQHLLRAARATVGHILSNQPDMVVLVDSRVFNTNLARVLRQRGYGGRIVYYVAPVRWQSLYDPQEHERSLSNSRFTTIKRYCDLALPIYPVSLEVYEELGIPYEFYGHPLCELARPELSDSQFSDLAGIDYQADDPPLIIGALPGSRLGEVREIGPPVYRALRLLEEVFLGDEELPIAQFVTPLAAPELKTPVLDAARTAGLARLTLIDSRYSFDLMSRARLMIVKSGTGLHQCMLLGVPAIMCYRVAPTSAALARLMRFRMPFYGLPNLLAGRCIVPELIQDDCTHVKIAELAGSLLFEEDERAAMLAAFANLRQTACKPEPLRRTAERLQDLLKH